MKVKFLPDNIEVEIKPNESVLKVAHDNGIHIKSVCKGVPSCAECRIQIAEGEHNVFPPISTEINLIGSAYFIDRSRLACQLKCFGDVTIDLKEQVEKASRNLASKRPRGSRVDNDDYDAGSSSAIQGSIVLDDKKVFEEIEEIEESERRAPPQQQQRNQRSHNQGPRQQGHGPRPQNQGSRSQNNQNQRSQGSAQQSNRPHHKPKPKS